MRVLVVNPGSSSLKLAVVADGQDTAGVTVASWDGAAPERPIAELLATGPVDAVGVRVVHGGHRTRAELLDAAVLADLDRWTPLAPVHQARSLAAARAVADLLPGTPVVGCFDTAFHADLPDHALTYPVPREWTRRWGLRRFGFHGLSCAHATRRAAELLDRPVDELGLVCCHVGAGASVTAIEGGRSVDTSMGFTPLDGVAMATRPGSLDPGLLLHVLSQPGVTLDQVRADLHHRSGLAGMSGTDGDVRAVLAARAAGSVNADLALRVYLHRLRREVAAQAVSLRRLDALVLTGGVVEHHAPVRAALAEGLAPLGVEVDWRRNADRGDRLISPPDARVAVLVLAAGEELEIAAQTEAVLAADQDRVAADGVRVAADGDRVAADQDRRVAGRGAAVAGRDRAVAESNGLVPAGFAARGTGQERSGEESHE